MAASDPFSDFDRDCMREALAEGAKGVGSTSPNPPVGAVLASVGRILGRGWHRRAGEPHAEVHALADAEAQGHDPRGATLYVTLEPCSSHGRTPPCVDAILRAGIGRVVVAANDPDPRHRGRGFEILRGAGVVAEAGLLAAEAEEQLRFFTSRVTRGRPWLIAKTAATLDGRTALGSGEGQWISSEASREDVQSWRRLCDAILIGGATLRADDPALTLRGPHAEGREQPLRVVLSAGGATLPDGARLFRDEHAERTRVYRGIPLRAALKRLSAEEGVNAVLLESGGRLLGEAFREGLVDELVLYLAPRLGGGERRLFPAEDFSTALGRIEVTRIGPDIRIVGRPTRL